MDDFNIFTDKDRKDLSYAACVGGSTLTGAAIGRFIGLPGLAAGAAVGLAFGLLTCNRLSPVIERKIFASNERLTERELAQALAVVRDQAGARTKAEAMFLLGEARSAAAALGPDLAARAASSPPPRLAAAHLLSQAPRSA